MRFASARHALGPRASLLLAATPANGARPQECLDPGRRAPAIYDGRVLADAVTRGTEIVVLASIIGPLVILGIVIFVFFRSARRFDEDEARRRSARERSGRQTNLG